MIKILIKSFLWILTIGLILALAAFLWLKSLWKEAIREDDLNSLITEVQNSDPLPPDFLETVEKVYPGFFEKNAFGYALHAFFSDEEQEICPCLRLTRTQAFTKKRLYKRSPGMTNIEESSIYWEVEKRLDQKACFTFYVRQMDFYRHGIGFDAASRSLFHLPLEDLNQRQQLELLVLAKHPVVFDKTRHPAVFEKEVQKLESRLGSRD